jgi:benzoate-CoA ligase family protein
MAGGVPVSEQSREAYNATVDLLERNLAPGRSERPYLRAEQRTWSYDEVAAAADAAGAGLLDMGIEPGDRVVLLLHDSPEFVIAFWGTIKAGIVPVPVGIGLSASDVAFILADSEARAIICDATTTDIVLGALDPSKCACIVVGGRTGTGVRSWDETCGRPASLAPAHTTGEDIALWLYTSGTTGIPKAVMHRHRHLKVQPDGLVSQVLEMGPDDVVLSVSKMFFAYGLGNSVYLPAATGASVVLSGGPSVPAAVADLLTAMGPTVVFGVPAFYAGLSHLTEAKMPGSLRAAVSAGEVLSKDQFERFHDRFGVQLLDGLGSTEALHHFTSNRPDDIVPGSAGVALTGYEVMVLDRDQQPLDEGHDGELWVRGPTTFAGYWRRPDLSARAYMDGWMRTGDLVRMVDGRVYHQGRLDDLLKVGGIWVAPMEIEDVLCGHDAVIDAAVVAVDDGSGVPIVKAFVMSARTDGTLQRELRRLCRSRLATYKVPQSIEIVSALPRTVAGKVQRFALRSDRSAAEADE